MGINPGPSWFRSILDDASITVVLGTERLTERGLQISVCVINPDGSVQGWQDKGQIDPSEEAIYPALGAERRVFTAGPPASLQTSE